MAESNYYIELLNDGSGNYNCVVHNGGTAPLIGTMLQIPQIENLNNPSQQVVTAATNATPIVITTAAAHGWSVGDVITINGALVNTGANGTFKISVVGTSTTATLLNSAGNGTYTASSGVATKLGTTKAVYTAAQAAIRAVLCDRAAGN